MSWVDRLLPLWIIGAMVLGVLLGYYVPAVGGSGGSMGSFFVVIESLGMNRFTSTAPFLLIFNATALHAHHCVFSLPSTQEEAWVVCQQQQQQRVAAGSSSHEK
jgi:hypothetical protein